MNIRTFAKRTALASLIMLSSTAAYAANWTITSTGASTGSWSAVSPTVPGWNIASFPNAPGAVAQLISAPAGMGAVPVITTQDTGAAVTVGTINFGNNNDLGPFYWQISNTNGITMNSGGAGFATISNSNQNVAEGELFIAGGSSKLVTLADNLHIVNTTTNSQDPDGAIAIDCVVTGTGNITLNSSQAIDTNAVTIRGGMELTRPNTFTGNVTLERGLFGISVATALGPAATNTFNLGLSDANSAKLVQRKEANITVPNNIVVATGNTGTLTLGSGTLASISTYSGTVTLGSNLNIDSTTTVAFPGAVNAGTGLASSGISLSGLVSSVVGTTTGIIKTGTGFANITNPANTYSGDTVVSAGTLFVAAGANVIPDGAGHGNVIVNSGATLVWSSNDVDLINGLGGSGTVTTNSVSALVGSTLPVGGNDATSTFSGSLQNNGTKTLAIEKRGLGTLTLSGTNSNTGPMDVQGGGTLQFAKVNSLLNGTPTNWTNSTIFIEPNSTMAFNVGGTGEFAASDIDTIKGTGITGTNVGGFGNGSFLGLDTTNASGGSFAYGSSISDSAGGTNSVGLKKLGTNTLILSGANTYTGQTFINAGTLLFNGTHTGGGNYTVASNATLGGSGSISSNVIGLSNSTLAPGNSTTVGKLTVGGNVDLSAGAAMNWKLGGLSASGPGTNFDQLSVGSVTLGGTSKLSLDFSTLALASRPGQGNTFWNAGHTWNIIDTAAGTSTNFASVSGAAGPGSWTTAIGTLGDIGDILLRYVAGDISSAAGVGIPDAFVGGDDLNVILAHWGQNVATGNLTLGDLSGPTGVPDGFVGGDDLNIILANWGKGPAAVGTGLDGGGGAAITAIPEPSTVLLAGIGLASLALIRKRRTK